MIYATSSKRIIIDGSVGIGATSPAYNLDVSGTLRATGAVYFNSSLGVTGVIGASAIQTTNTDAYSLILRNSAAAALYVQNTTTSGTIASFRYGSVTAGSGTSVLDINSGSIVSSVGYSKSGCSDSDILLGGGGTCNRGDV